MTYFKVECDKCGHQFLLSPDLVGIQDVVPFGKTRYFSCPECGYKYPFMIEDREQQGYMKELDYLQSRIDTRLKRDKEIPPFLEKRFHKVLEDSQNHQVFLRDKYQKVVTDQLNQSDIETNS